MKYFLITFVLCTQVFAQDMKASKDFIAETKPEFTKEAPVELKEAKAAGELDELSVYAHEKGNGGDPFEVNAEAFPDRPKLERALRTVEKALVESNLPKELRDKTIAEAQVLNTNGKYLYLESIILFGAEVPEGYEIPLDAKKFLGLGAMTVAQPGANIYFSSRSLNYDDSRFAHLLLHEILHHTIPDSLGKSEEFVDEMSTQILSGSISAAFLLALRVKVYLKNNGIYADQLADSFYEWSKVEQICYDIDWLNRAVMSKKSKVEHREFCRDGRFKAVARYYGIKNFKSKNVSKVKFYDFIDQYMCVGINPEFCSLYIKGFLNWLKTQHGLTYEKDLEWKTFKKRPQFTLDRFFNFE